MPRSVTISYSVTAEAPQTPDGVRVRLEIADAIDMTDSIFAYRLLPYDLQTNAKAAFFSHVCSPVDLEDYVKNDPDDVVETDNWFRLNYVDILVRSTYEAENFIAVIREDITKLIHSLNRLDALSDFTEEDLG